MEISGYRTYLSNLIQMSLVVEAKQIIAWFLYMPLRRDRVNSLWKADILSNSCKSLGCWQQVFFLFCVAPQLLSQHHTLGQNSTHFCCVFSLESPLARVMAGLLPDLRELTRATLPRFIGPPWKFLTNNSQQLSYCSILPQIIYHFPYLLND